MVLLAGVLAAVALAYAGSLDGGFLLDARALVLENPRVHAATLENVRFLLTHDYWQPHSTDGLYRPLTTLSFLANWALLGNADRPFGSHLVNLLLHLACTVLLLRQVLG